MSENVFCLPPDSYKRDLNVLEHYVEQNAHYLSKMTGDSYEECRAFVMDGIKNRQFKKMRNPTVTYFQRGENGDRSTQTASLTDYIKSVVANNEILVPTFTTYLHPSVKPSLLVGFMDKNVKKRSVAKKAMFVAKAKGMKALYAAKKTEQTSKKLKNNACSGAFVAAGSILNNPTAHSTLTSITRSVSSFGNTVNERTIAGNRHYWSTDVALNNLISITKETDYVRLSTVMKKYNLREPNVYETMACVTYSTDLYGASGQGMTDIEAFVKKLDGLERAAFVYTGDMYHLRIHNPEMIRDFLTEMSTKVVSTEGEDSVGYMRGLDESLMTVVHAICSDEARGHGKDYEQIAKAGHVHTLAATGRNLAATIQKYKDFIQTFFVTNNLPPSIAYVKNMLRRVVLLSDTDSTCYSVDEWLQWYFNKIEFNTQAFGLSSVVSFMATQSVVHALAVFSTNMNVEKKRLHTLAMKNEYTWKAMAITSVAKHYFALTTMQEGDVFRKDEAEIKGVHLKNSTNPITITEDAERIMVETLTTVSSGGKIKIVPILNHIASVEHSIRESILKGEIEFYRRSKIKDPESYKKSEEESPYLHHLLWNQVFQQKYGSIAEPPYSVVKIPTTLSTKTQTKAWLDSIKDVELSNRLRTWFIKNNKDTVPTFYLPVAYLTAYGMVPEIATVIDVRRIILDLTNVYRIVLETMGIFFKGGRLISEHGY